MLKMKFILFLSATICIADCKSGHDKPTGADGWLKGDVENKFETIASQLRGFDMAMAETGYRYQELYWAGKDENREYANCQLSKIKLAIKNGLQRRPKRAKSAEHFLNSVLPAMQEPINNKDTTLFNHHFQLLTAGCNSCHSMEKVAFFFVKPPLEQKSPIRK